MRIAPREDERVRGLRAALGDNERLLDRHVLLLQLLEGRDLLVVVPLAIGTKDSLAVIPDRIDQLGPLAVALAGREQPWLKPRARPRDGEPLAVEPLEVVEPDWEAARLEGNRRRAGIARAVDTVVFDRQRAVDREPRAVVGVEREGVVAVGRHLEEAREHVAETVGPQRGGHGDVEATARHRPDVFGLEFVEGRQARPRVAVEPELQVVEVVADGGVIRLPVAGHAKLVLDFGDCFLGGIATAVQVGELLLVGGPLGVVGEELPLDLFPVVGHRRDVLEEGEQAVVVLLRDRVDLVVVAAGAVDRQAEERLPGGGDEVIEPVVPRLHAVGRLVVPEPEPVVAGGDQVVG